MVKVQSPLATTSPPTPDYLQVTASSVAQSEGGPLVALDCAISTGAGSRSWIERDPDFAKIRELSRFREIMARLE